MARQNPFHKTLLQLRRCEEGQVHDELTLTRRELDLVRVRIDDFQEEIDGYAYAAQIVLARGDSASAEVFRRKMQALTVRRAAEVGRLWEVKAAWTQCRQKLAKATDLRLALQGQIALQANPPAPAGQPLAEIQ